MKDRGSAARVLVCRPLCALQASKVRARGSDGRRAVWRQRKNVWPASAGRSGKRGERAGAKKVHLVHPDYGREVVAPRLAGSRR